MRRPGRSELQRRRSRLEVRMVRGERHQRPAHRRTASADQARRAADQLRHGQTFDEVLRENGASPRRGRRDPRGFRRQARRTPVADGQKVILAIRRRATIPISGAASPASRSTATISCRRGRGQRRRAIYVASRDQLAARARASAAAERRPKAASASIKASTRRRSSRGCRSRSSRNSSTPSSTTSISSARRSPAIR